MTEKEREDGAEVRSVRGGKTAADCALVNGGDGASAPRADEPGQAGPQGCARACAPRSAPQRSAPQRSSRGTSAAPGKSDPHSARSFQPFRACAPQRAWQTSELTRAESDPHSARAPILLHSRPLRQDDCGAAIDLNAPLALGIGGRHGMAGWLQMPRHYHEWQSSAVGSRGRPVHSGLEASAKQDSTDIRRVVGRGGATGSARSAAQHD